MSLTVEGRFFTIESILLSNASPFPSPALGILTGFEAVVAVVEEGGLADLERDLSGLADDF